MDNQDNKRGIAALFRKKRENILVVDDEPLVRKSISKYLIEIGYDSDTAEDGSQAIEKLAENKYDLILTDLRMPNVDGRQLLKYMSENHPEIPKIVFTAFGEEEDIIHALQAGARDYLTKPIVDLKILDHSVGKALELKKLNDEKNRFVEQIKQINEIISMLNRGISTDAIFYSLSSALKKIIEFNRLDFIIVDQEKNQLFSKLEDSDSKLFFRESHYAEFEEFVRACINNNKKAVIVHDIGKSDAKDNTGKNISTLQKKGLKSLLILPLIIGDITRGYLVFSSIEPDFFNESHISFLESIVGQVSFSIQRGELLAKQKKHTFELELLIEKRADEISRTQKTTIFALSKLAEARDPGTGEHLERIRVYSVLIAKLLKEISENDEITNQFLKDLYDCSILHDIGKVGISDTILLKPDDLTAEEMEIMKTHARIGYEALNQASQGLGGNSFLNMAMDICLFHHERWDGTGYPEGLKGDEIPISARIVRLCDVYDALTSERPYKEAFSHDKSISMMEERSIHFDPDLFRLFKEHAEEFNIIRNEYSDKNNTDNKIC